MSDQGPTEVEQAPVQAQDPNAAVAAVVGGPRPGSLEDRIAKRRDALEKATTELFDVPNFEGIFKVELQILSGQAQYKVAESHRRVRNEYQQNIRSASDILLRATVGIHAVVDPDEDKTQLAEGFTWLDAAKAADKSFDPTTPARVALTRVLGEAGVISLFHEYERWVESRGQKLEEELARD